MRLSHKVFIDANVLISAFDSLHNRFMVANRILRGLQNQAFDRSLVISQYVLSEVLAYVTYQQKKFDYPVNLREDFVNRTSDFINSRYVDLIFANDQEAAAGFDLVKTYPTLAASLADWISLILMVRYKIPVIQTFDRDFNSIKKNVPQFKDIEIWSI